MIRPIITYRSVVYGSASKTHQVRIKIFQNKHLRKFTHATRYASHDVIHRDLKIKPVFGEKKKIP